MIKPSSHFCKISPFRDAIIHRVCFKDVVVILQCCLIVRRVMVRSEATWQFVPIRESPLWCDKSSNEIATLMRNF